MSIDLDRLTILAVSVALGMAMLNVVFGILKFVEHSSVLMDILGYFDVGNELTFPSWFTSILLAIAALGSFAASPTTSNTARGYVWLGWLLLYLSLDEATALHERLSPLARDLFGDLRGFGREWAILGAIIAVLVFLLFLGFLKALPQGTRLGLATGGVVFVISAVVIEFVGGYFLETYGAGVASDVSTIVEEFGEMLGVIIVARTLFLVVRDGEANVRLRTVLWPRLGTHQR